MSKPEKASAQYNDLIGSSAADWQQGFADHKAYTEMGLDPERWFIVGMELFGGTEGGPGTMIVSALAADMSVVGDSFERRHAYAGANGGRLPVRRFTRSLPVATAISLFKRLDIVLQASPKRLGAELDVVED